jgi:translation initiation factor 5A
MLKGFPCKVLETAISKPGKHGSAKIHVTGIDLFTNKKIDDIFSTAGTAWSPVVTKVEYEVADINTDGFVSLIEKDNTLKENIKLPADQDLREMLEKCWEENNNDCQVYFTLIAACGQ